MNQDTNLFMKNLWINNYNNIKTKPLILKFNHSKHTV